jgi:hypothetical protein
MSFSSVTSHPTFIPASKPGFPVHTTNPNYTFLATHQSLSSTTFPSTSPPSFPATASPFSPKSSVNALSGKIASLSFASPQKTVKNQSTDKLLGKRTKGMWMFDTLLYPVLTNAAVFAISVLATYATTYGGPRNFMRVRGNWAREQLQKLFKMSPQTAKETIMITFSFLDGCVMAPVVKMFEDRRLKIAEIFDKWLGTTPNDKSVYDREPKQTWGSVLGGRTTAFALVVPTAKLLSKKIKGERSLNEMLFAQPGKKIGEGLMKVWPSLQKRFPTLNIAGLMEVCALEAFYTSLCTAGLYISSRFLASRNGK